MAATAPRAPPVRGEAARHPCCSQTAAAPLASTGAAAMTKNGTTRAYISAPCASSISTSRSATDRRRAEGDEAPLLGVPVAVKDEMDIAGEITSRGSGTVSTPALTTPRWCGGCARRAP